MTFLFKAPPAPVEGGTVSVSAKAYRGAQPTSGDRVFLWWTEDRGGRGLSGVGRCLSVHHTQGLVQATVELIALHESGVGFGKAQVAPFRDVESDRPEATLSKKLFRQAHNKVVALTPDEEAFLDSYF